jgi:hypothetical protein
MCLDMVLNRIRREGSRLKAGGQPDLIGLAIRASWEIT